MILFSLRRLIVCLKACTGVTEDWSNAQIRTPLPSLTVPMTLNSNHFQVCLFDCLFVCLQNFLFTFFLLRCLQALKSFPWSKYRQEKMYVYFLLETKMNLPRATRSDPSWSYWAQDPPLLLPRLKKIFINSTFFIFLIVMLEKRCLFIR